MPGLVIHQITHDGKSRTERGAGFAPVGECISYYKQVSKSDRQLWVMHPDGSEAHPVSPVGWPMTCGWSLDGTRIAYIFANKNDPNSEASVCVYDVASGETKKTTGGYKRGYFGAGGDAPPIWAPDSKHFSYHIYDSNRGVQLPVIFPVDGSTPVTLAMNLAGTKAFDSQGSWSADGQQVTFAAFPTKDAAPEIYISNINGTGLKQVTDDRRDCGEPKWSPDGQWIVFFSAKDRYPDEVRNGWNWDILMVRPDGSDEQTLISGRSQSTEGRNSFVHPEWAPNQAYIICYGSMRDAKGGSHNAIFSIDWKKKKWQRIMGSLPNAREYNELHDWGISPDSQKVFHHGFTYVVRGANEDQESDYGDILELYDVPTGKTTTLFSGRQGKDPSYLYEDAESWASDSKRILICLGKVISWTSEEFEPDLYVLEVPGTLASPVSEITSPGEAAPSTPLVTAEPRSVAAPESATSYTLVQPKYMTAQQALEMLPAADRANVIVNMERNLLIVNGPPEMAQRLRDYLQPIDTPAPQVVMDVLVTEMSKTASRELGLDWSYAKGHLGAILPTRDFGPGQIFYQGVQRLGEEFFVSLNALEEQGEVTIRANPRLTAVSGKTATMNIRRTKYYFYTQGYDSFGRPIIQQSDISADIGGKITPRVLGEGNLQIEVEVMVGNFAFTTTSSLPDVTARQTNTSVMLKDGETIVIGGLVLKQETRSTNKTPVLGDLPLVGQLFRSTHRRIEENVLTILITPHISTEERIAPQE